MESQKLAEGVWLAGGGSHNSVIVEFSDFVAVIEAPLNEERSLAVIDEVHKLAPNKPIRYIVNTHHHFDHSGGLRTYVSEGATVITHEGNREYYERVVLLPGPGTVHHDRLSDWYPRFSVARNLSFDTVDQSRAYFPSKHVVSDGVRTLDIYPVQGAVHSATMVMAYLPKERMLVNGDLYSPPAPGAPPPAAPSASMTNLYQNMQRLKLNVAQHVPIHGRVGTNEEFLKIVAAKPPSQ